MGNPRKRIAKLPAKLLAIREKLGVSQSQLATLLELENEYEVLMRDGLGLI